MKGQTQWQKRIFKVMDRGETQLFLGVLLLLSLFLNESWVLGNADDSSDDALYGILTFIFVIFALETVVLSVVQPHYFLGFFFWMDLIGTLSIILDIGWISESFLKSGSSNQASILRATRAAKLGARYGRLMRILKLMKFMQYMPCFKRDDETDKPEPTLTAVRKVSNQLTNSLSQRVAGLTMLFVIVLPFLAYDDLSDDSVQAWVNTLKLTGKTSTTTDAVLLEYINKFRTFYRTKAQHLQRLVMTGPYTTAVDYSWYSDSDIRDDNLIEYTSDYVVSSTTYTVTAYMDKTIPHQMEAMYGIIIIVMVIFVLVFFSASFQNSVDSLVVLPLEHIMESLRNSASALLKSMKAMEEEEKEGDEEGYYSDDDEELETAMLEKMVDKLVRIVGHMTKSDLVMAEGDKNVDSATANWLSATYGDGSKRVEQVALTSADEQLHSKRMSQLSTDHTIACSPELLNSWDFDVLDYDKAQLTDIFVYIFSVLNIFDEFNVPQAKFRSFLDELTGKYKDNTYHNFKHGFDVGHTVYRVVTEPNLHLTLSHLEFFSLLVAAIGHDVGHPGVNNAYLVKAKNELAIQHNDRSPLENMHCAVIYSILGHDKTNIFAGLNDQQWRESRKLILTVVLGTDMAHHFEQIGKTNVFLETYGDDFNRFCSGEKDSVECLGEEKDRLFLMEICLHCADISNPYKPFKICARWAELVVEEFARQGDRERSEGLEISPMMDRATIQLCNMQMGFVEFVVAPLIIAFIKILPPIANIGTTMADNYCAWADKRILEIKAEDVATMDQAKKDEEIGKLNERKMKFNEKLAFAKGLSEMPRRRKSVSVTTV